MNRKLERAYRRFADFLQCRPWVVLGLLSASVAWSLALARTMKFDFTPQAIYRSNDDLVSYSEEFKRTFGYDEAVVLVVLEATGEFDVLDAPALQWQKDIVADLARVSHVHSVESLVTLHAPALTLSGMELFPIVAERMDDEAAEKARGVFETQPLVRSGMLSPDNRVTGIAVFLNPHARDIASMREVVGAIRAAVAARPLPAGYNVQFSGLPVMRVQVVNDLRDDQMTLLPLAGIVYLIVLGLMFRQFCGAILPLVAVGIGLTWTMATLAIMHESVNIVTNILPELLLIIGVSSSVQIISGYSEEVAAAPGCLGQAVLATIVKMTPACLLAGLTTAIGFASLATAHSVVLRSFGVQAAIGVGYQYLCTLIFLGTVLRYFAPPRFADLEEVRLGLTTRTVTAAGFAVARHPWLTVAAALTIVAGAGWAGSAVTINSFSILETFSEDRPIVQTLRLVERQLAGIMPLEVSLQAHESGQFLEPEVYHHTREIEHAARQIPGIISVQSYADLYRIILEHGPRRRVTETDRELVPPGSVGRARLARTAAFIERFSEAFHYNSFVSLDGKRARIRMRLQEIGSHKTLELIHELETHLARAFPAGGPIEARLTGEAYVNAHALTTLIRDLFWSLVTASLVIFSLIAIEFRSLRAGLIAALPNLTPLLITLGYMGLRGYDMNVANVIVFTICLGLADDNTIHFLYRFREELHADGNVTAAIERAFRGTGRAIVATSLLLAAGTMVLLVSNFVPTRRFAELTCVTILGNLLGVLLLLPACLVLAWKVPEVGHEGRRSPATCPPP
jgi:predicted RND superfamily exporter protein